MCLISFLVILVLIGAAVFSLLRNNGGDTATASHDVLGRSDPAATPDYTQPVLTDGAWIASHSGVRLDFTKQLFTRGGTVICPTLERLTRVFADIASGGSRNALFENVISKK